MDTVLNQSAAGAVMQGVLFTADPVHGATFQIHHREHAYSVGFDGVEKSVRKAANEAASNRADDESARLGKFEDGTGAVLDLIKEGRAEPRTFQIIEESGVAQFPSGQPMKGDVLHSLELGSCLTEGLFGGASRIRTQVHLLVSPLGFFRPQPSVFLVGEGFEAFQ